MIIPVSEFCVPNIHYLWQIYTTRFHWKQGRKGKDFLHTNMLQRAADLGQLSTIEWTKVFCIWKGWDKTHIFHWVYIFVQCHIGDNTSGINLTCKYFEGKTFEPHWSISLLRQLIKLINNTVLHCGIKHLLVFEKGPNSHHVPLLFLLIGYQSRKTNI